MTMRILMTMRARLTRPQSSQRDEYDGVLADDTPDVVEDAAPCYAWAPTDAREVFDDAQVVAGAVLLAFPLTIDVQQSDVIQSVSDRLGRVLFPGPMQITSVIRHGRHRAVTARTQTGGR